MNKKSIQIFSFISLLAILTISLAGCKNKEEQTTNTTNTSANRVSTELEIPQNETIDTLNSVNTTQEITKGAHDSEPIEEELASYSTKLSGKNSPRSRNIGITSSTLNETTVAPGQTFSFCNTIGVCTAEKGYEEADTFDHDGNKIQTLGGGNCQVSSTLYNVVLQIPELKVTERHPHSKKVHYVPEDKDAAVSHGSVDFKFKNNMENTIKIYANADLSGVTIRIVKITQ